MKPKLLTLITSMLCLIIIPAVTLAAPPKSPKKSKANEAKLQELKEKFNNAKGADKANYANEILALSPKDKDANCVLGTFARLNKETCKAYHHYNIVIKQDSDCKPSVKPFLEASASLCKDEPNSSPNAKANEAKLKELKEKFNNAKGMNKVNYANEILALSPKDKDANCLIGTNAQIRNEKCNAYRHYITVTEQNSDCKPSVKPFIEANASLCKDEANRASTHQTKNSAQLNALIKQFNASKAHEKQLIAQKIIKLDPYHVEANCVIGTRAKIGKDTCTAYQHYKIVADQGKDCTPKIGSFIQKNAKQCEPHTQTAPNTDTSTPEPEYVDLESALITANGPAKTEIAQKILISNPKHINANCQMGETYFMTDRCTAYKHYKIVLDQGYDCVPSGRDFVRMNEATCASTSYVDEYQH